MSKAERITSVADFLGARYGKSQTVAVVTTLIAVTAALPYIALQLKAISASVATMVPGVTDIAMLPVIGDLALFVAVALALFAILFGTRHADATEHQDGMMLAVAVEAVVKLFAFLAVGIFVTFVLFDGPGDLYAQAAATPEIAAKIRPRPRRAAAGSRRRRWRSSPACSCRGSSTSRWWRTTARARSAAPPGCSRPISSPSTFSSCRSPRPGC